MINILLNGCNGKMGQTIISQVEKFENFSVVAGVDVVENLNNPQFPIYRNPEHIKEKIDVIIDFSIPLASLNILTYAQNKNIPIVIATTGFSHDQLTVIENASKHIPIFKTANMSLGVNLMLKLVSEAAKILEKDYDIEIIEKHHNRKIDAPSGTALLIADTIKESIHKDVFYVYDRHSKREKRDNCEIGIHSIRGGNIVGEHSAIFAGENEILEITHKAESRSVFADGALNAAEFITKQLPGMYSMKDLV